jgi:hypothetical protein
MSDLVYTFHLKRCQAMDMDDVEANTCTTLVVSAMDVDKPSPSRLPYGKANGVSYVT